MNNIMYRIIGDEVCGVLTDYDLSSWTASLTLDYSKTSQQRTGTPPFMAYGLLDGRDALHLYRHDVESLFYIMLILATHYEVQAPKWKKGQRVQTRPGGGVRTRQGGRIRPRQWIRIRQGLKELPYRAWFDQPSFTALASFKHTFLSDTEDLRLSPTFEGFRGWLEDLHQSFRRGIRSRQIHMEELTSLQRRNGRSGGGTVPTFDDETLAGHVPYSALVDPVRSLKGDLADLVIRYDPSPPPASDLDQCGSI